MKTKLLGLMVIVAWLGLSPASATTYDYNFSLSLGDGGSNGTVAIGSITGYIDTSCDNNCYLTSTNSSWSLTASDGTSVSSTTGGGIISGTALEATPTGIYTQGGFGSIFFCGDVSNCPGSGQTLAFQNLQLNGGFGAPGVASLITWYEGSSVVYQTGAIGHLPGIVSQVGFTIGPFCQLGPCLSPTPLPAAFPLFATGLGALGLLGWRRKRKNAAALSAA
jgi:hypothetical protein